MKTKLTTLALSLIATLAFGHGGVELGPNGGRLLEFSKNESMHGEVTVKGGKFNIALFDKKMKPVPMTDQVLTATTGDRDNPKKLEVTRTDKGFSLPAVKPGEWLIVQFKSAPGAKAITARMEYDTGKCDACGNPEWLCKCAAEKEKK
jgi:hypothetical protein